MANLRLMKTLLEGLRFTCQGCGSPFMSGPSSPTYWALEYYTLILLLGFGFP